MERYLKDFNKVSLADGNYNIVYNNLREIYSKNKDTYFLVLERAVMSGPEKGTIHEEWFNVESDYLRGKLIHTIAMHYGDVPEAHEAVQKLNKLVVNKAMEEITLDTGENGYQQLTINAVLEEEEEKEIEKTVEEEIEKTGEKGIAVEGGKATVNKRKSSKKKNDKKEKEKENIEKILDEVYMNMELKSDPDMDGYETMTEEQKIAVFDGFIFSTEEMISALGENGVEIWNTTGLVNCIQDEGPEA